MMYTLFTILICTSLANTLSKISEILTEESLHYNDCDNLPNIAQASPSLGHKIAQVVCESRTKAVNGNEDLVTAFGVLICVKYGLFGVLCSLLTYLVSTFTSLESNKQINDQEKDELNTEIGEPDDYETPAKQESPLLVTPQPVLDVLPVLDTLPQLDTEFKVEDLTLDEKSLSLSDDEKEKSQDLRRFGDLADLNLPENDIIDFEVYKTNLDLPKCYAARARSFSEPTGSERFIAYQSLENVSFNPQAWIGEPNPTQISPALMPLETETQGNSEAFVAGNTGFSTQPGSPTHFDAFDLAQSEPGQTKVVDNVNKVNERKPMVFVGGVSASTTSIELVTELKSQGFNVTVLPRIRYGVSFGFCPDLVLSSIEEVEKMLAMGRIWVKDRWVDVRPYIPKDTDPVETANKDVQTSDVLEMVPSSPPTMGTVVHIQDSVGDSVAYISREDLLNPCPSSPESLSGGHSSPPILSPATQFLPYQFFPNPTQGVSPQMYPMLNPYLYPTPGEYMFQQQPFATPSPPGYHLAEETVQHPISLDAH